jgi:hypothetical protein
MVRKDGAQRKGPNRAEIRAAEKQNGSVRHLIDRRGKAS